MLFSFSSIYFFMACVEKVIGRKKSQDRVVTITFSPNMKNKNKKISTLVS